MDEALLVTEVWSDEFWRLTATTVGEIAGYCYLSTRRHISDISDLDGGEQECFGAVVARTSSAIKQATGADHICVYVLGDGVDHLHLHLAPRRGSTSPLVDDPIKGARHRVILRSGEEVWVSDRYPLQPRELMNAAIADIREHLAG
jgi:diadenosine tetraphosphate (Ap4A) HIT family hydrolase